METYIFRYSFLLAANPRLIYCNCELVIKTAWLFAQQQTIAFKSYYFSLGTLSEK